MTMPEQTESVVPVLPLGAAIASVGVSLPDTVVPNAHIAPRIGVTDEWIVRRTGIRTRRVARPDERGIVSHHRERLNADDLDPRRVGGAN